MPDERRQHPDTRERLAAIQEGYLQLSHRLLAAVIFQAVVLVLTLLAFGYLVHQNAERITETCTRTHRVVESLLAVVDDAAARVKRYEKDGIFTHSQARQAFTDARRQAGLIRPADCNPKAQ